MQPWEINDLINSWVETIATLPVSEFYPTAVVKDTGIPGDIVFTKLMEMVRDGKLMVTWEIKCPQCFVRIGNADNPEIMGTKTCYLCGEEYEISLDMIYPIFRVNPEYKQYAKNNINKKKLLSQSQKILGAYSRSLYPSHNQLHCHN